MVVQNGITALASSRTQPTSSSDGGPVRHLGIPAIALLLVLPVLGLGPAEFVGASGASALDVDGWIARHAGPDGLDDEAAAISVSPDGSTVFVTGTSGTSGSGTELLTVAYDAPTGQALWTARYNGPSDLGDSAVDITVSPDGDRVFVLGNLEVSDLRYDYVTIAYAAETGEVIWDSRYNGVFGLDFATAIAAGPDGDSVYVTGLSVTTLTTDSINSAYGTVAYNAETGNQRWTARYSGPGGDLDGAWDLTVAPDGSQIYVTGASHGGSSENDYATVAYGTGLGTEAWVARYDGPAGADDRAFAITATPDGETVAVTGTSQGSGTGEDYATAAYRSDDGTQLWTSRYDGPGSASDDANAISLSPDGSALYVTGASDSGQSSDYATLRYETATGAESWVARYDGPAQGSDGATAIDVSPSGDTVYVTGESRGIESGSDYATVAYTASTGEETTLSRYEGPGADTDAATDLVARPDGPGVYVTGSSETVDRDDDYATIFYKTLDPVASIAIDQAIADRSADDDRTPVTLTVTAEDQDGQVVEIDSATEVRWLIDDPGGGTFEDNVFTPGTTAGTYNITAVYIASGRVDTSAFTISPGAFAAITIDQRGAAQVVDTPSDVTFTATPRDAWGNPTDDPIDSATDIDWSLDNPVGGAFDANVLSPGTVPGPYWVNATLVADPTIADEASFLLIDKVARFDGGANDGDQVEAVTSTPDGSIVFVTGSSDSDATDDDLATVAYNANGRALWEARYDGPVNGRDLAEDSGISPDGATVFATGTSDGDGTSNDFATVAYDSGSGQERWVARYDGSSGRDGVRSLAVSPDGTAVFITGSSDGGDTGDDYATVAYDATTGEELWTARYDGPGSQRDRPAGIAVSPDGSTVFVTGTSRATSSVDSRDYATVAYDASTGDEVWAVRHDGPGGDRDTASGIAITPDGATVVATGTVVGPSGDRLYGTVAYDAATGDQAWAATYGGYGGASNAAYALATSPDGSVVAVTGRTQSPTTSNDIGTVVYATDDGTLLWEDRYDGPVHGSDFPSAITFDQEADAVYVSASVDGGSETSRDFAVLAYRIDDPAPAWTLRYDGPDNDYDVSVDMAVAPGGSLFLAGSSRGATTSYDFATLFMNVTAPPADISITQTDRGYPATGPVEATYTVTGTDSQGNPVPVASAANVTWTLDDPAGGSFDRNTLTTGTTPGAYTITATSDLHPSITDATSTVLFDALASVSIDQVNLSRAAGDTGPIGFTAAAEDTAGNAFEVASHGVGWSLDDPAGGSFDGNTLSPGTTAGNYTVAIAADDDPTVNDQTGFTITPGPLSAIEIDQRNLEQSADDAGSITYTVTGQDAFGNPVGVDDVNEVGWEINDPAGGTFDQNVLSTGTTAGGYTVMATLEGDPSIEGSTAFTVLPGNVTSVKINERDLKHPSGVDETLEYTASAWDAFGNLVDLDPATQVGWAIDDPAGGTFEANLLTPGETVGNYTVNATLLANETVTDSTGFFITEAGVAPVGLFAQPGPDRGQVTVSWRPPPDAADAVIQYDVHAADVSGGPYELVEQTEPGTLEATEQGLTDGQTRFYVVHAVYPDGQGPASQEVNASTPTRPEAPATIATRPGPGSSVITVGWSLPEDTGGLPVLAYRIYRSDAPGEWTQVGATVDSMLWRDDDPVLLSPTPHAYRVTAVTGYGESPPTEVACSYAGAYNGLQALAPVLCDALYREGGG